MPKPWSSRGWGPGQGCCSRPGCRRWWRGFRRDAGPDRRKAGGGLAVKTNRGEDRAGACRAAAMQRENKVWVAMEKKGGSDGYDADDQAAVGGGYMGGDKAKGIIEGEDQQEPGETANQTGMAIISGRNWRIVSSSWVIKSAMSVTMASSQTITRCRTTTMSMSASKSRSTRGARWSFFCSCRRSCAAIILTVWRRLPVLECPL